MLDMPKSAPNAPAVDRRNPDQAQERKSGVVVAVYGARATVAARTMDLVTDASQFWSVGDLVSIYTKVGRVICLVQDMAAVDRVWDPKSDNYVHANVELLGEVQDVDGKAVFRRGIASYPALGSPVNRIRQSDLAAIYDLGQRKSTVIGQLVQAQIPATVDVEAMLKRHFAVVGTTGVGKSSAIAVLLRAAMRERPGMRILILDPHNEYTHAFRAESSTFEARRFELPFWLFQFEEFVEVLYRGANAPLEETDFLREAIAEARDKFGGDDRSGGLTKWSARADEGRADSPRPYRFADLLAGIDAEIGRLEPRHSRATLRNVRNRLDAIGNDPNYRFMFGKAAVDARVDFVTASLFRLHETERPVTVLRMAGIPADVVNASVSVLSRLAFDLCVNNRGRREILMVCEEAHRYVPADEALGFGPTRRALARIAKEGRKYGCYLGIVTQRPAELDPTILSQCSTVFAMRLSNAADQAIMRSAIPDNAAGALEFISALNNREAIAFGEAVATGMRMAFVAQDESSLPRMSADWEEQAATDEPEPPAPLKPISAPLPPEAIPNQFGRLAQPIPEPIAAPIAGPISAPSYGGGGGWRGEKRAGEPGGFGTRDWPSSDRTLRR